MNRRKIKFILTLLVMVLTVGASCGLTVKSADYNNMNADACVIMKDSDDDEIFATGTSTNGVCTVGEYKIELNTIGAGYPDGDSIHSSSVYLSEDGFDLCYEMSYYFYTESIYEGQPDIECYNRIVIDGKEFYYSIEDSGIRDLQPVLGERLNLYYVNDENSYLAITYEEHYAFLNEKEITLNGVSMVRYLDMEMLSESIDFTITKK